MNEPGESSVQRRVEALEAQVAELSRQVALLHQKLGGRPSAPASSYAPPASVPPPRPVPPRPPARPPRRAAWTALKSEDWLNKIGMGLLLFGLIFLFKYSIDQGWLTPQVRILFGGVLGVFLLGAGLRLHPKRRRLGQVLLGGGIATVYTTIFAAFQFYALLSFPLAFAAMGAVTLLAFFLALQQNDAAQAVVATLGGLGTPFLLYTGAGNVPGLVVYTCLVLLGSCGVYLYKGWRSLLVAAVVGGWLVLAVVWGDLIIGPTAPLQDRTALQLGALFCWLAFGGLVVVREVLHRRRPAQWPVAPLAWFAKVRLFERPSLVLAVAAPFITLLYSYDLWSLPDLAWGGLLVAVAGGYAVGYGYFYREGFKDLASAHGIAAALLLAIGCFYLFDAASACLLALAAEAFVLHLLARFLADRTLRFLGHGFSVVVALWVTVRLFDGGHTPALVNTVALSDLVVLALGFAAARTFRSEKLGIVYRLLAYVGVLGWLWRDLVLLSNGQAFVSVAWGLMALALLAYGWSRDADMPRNTGLVTLLVVVGKLFVVDLARLDAVWRILLFLGFGGLLLLVSYFFPSLWKPRAKQESQTLEHEEPV